tara:strand:+ start:2167 stop:2457 length:291 start_codon:yes stop_codon:yes gene_type:complete
MSDDLLAFLEKAIKHIEVDSWGKRGAPVVTLRDDTHFDFNENKLYGAIEIRVPDRDGSMKIFHTEVFSGSETVDELHDLLSNGLSIVLSKHPSWIK